MVKTKVFVGNLSFKTAEADLQREFEVAGKVASTNIISRGQRSLGYGFVEMESEEEAQKAVQVLNKKQIDGREINVELAKPPTENAPREPRPPRQPRAPRQPRPAGANVGGAPAAAGGVEGGEGAEGGAPRRRRRPSKPRGPRRVNPDGTPVEGGAAAGGAPAGGAPRAPREPREPRERRERPPRAPRPEGAAPRVAAPNTLFVANLPFTVDDDALSQIFAGLNLKTAHVVRKRNDRSKGFGFVEFHNEEDQKKALAATDKKVVDSRELIVKIARTEPLPVPGSPAVGDVKKEAAAGAPGSPKIN